MPAAAKRPTKDKKKPKNEARMLIEELSQKETHIRIAGVKLRRIPFGEESQRFELATDDHSCTCGVRIGMFHIFGCAQAECPGCLTREVDCPCEYYERA